MSNLDLLISASRNSSAWQLVLDKVPFQGQERMPVLSTTDNKGRPQSIKSSRLGKIRDLANGPAAKSIWKDAIAAREAFHQSLMRQHDQRFLQFALVNTSRLLMHLGRATVLENVGLYCDHTTGLPIIPATAIKGVASTWACWEANEAKLFLDNPQLQTLRTAESRDVFGDNAEDGSKSAGSILFLDAFPSAPPTLGVDIVNPHHKANGVPMERLTPNVFLQIEPDTTWMFGIVARNNTVSNALLHHVQAWVQESLTQVGIGAKTSSGYGKFRRRSPEEVDKAKKENDKKIAKEREIALLSADYSNETVFQNKVLRHADNPGQWNLLEKEIPKLSKTENASWMNKFREYTSGRAHRKLREKTWYPQ